MQQMLRVFGASVLLVGTVACDNDKQADRARAPSSAKPPVTAARPKAPRTRGQAAVQRAPQCLGMRIGCRALVTGEYVLDKKAIREAMRLGSHEELPPTINALNITLTLAHDSRTFEIEIRRASRGGQKTKTQRAVGTWTASGIVLELRSSGREPLSFSCEVSAVAVLRCKNNTSSDGLVLVFKRSSQP